MHSHLVGLDVWFLVGPFVYFHTSCVQTAKALARLRGCAGSPEPSLVAYVISTVISWAGSINKLSITTLQEQTNFHCTVTNTQQNFPTPHFFPSPFTAEFSWTQILPSSQPYNTAILTPWTFQSLYHWVHEMWLTDGVGKYGICQ